MMSRTEAYEAHLEQIQNLRDQADDAATRARSWRYLADDIAALSSRGIDYVKARDETMNQCHRMGRDIEGVVEELRAGADALEAEGLT